MPQLIAIYNGARPTAAALPQVTTGTSIKTMLQVQADRKFDIVGWGFSMDGSAAAEGVQWELIETGTVAATVVASVEADLVKWNDPDAEAVATELGILVGTAATGYTASAEGTITESRLFDARIEQPTGSLTYLFPLGERPKVNHDALLRVRCHAQAAVNAICWVLISI